jgi:hypothetical protein
MIPFLFQYTLLEPRLELFTLSLVVSFDSLTTKVWRVLFYNLLSFFFLPCFMLV